MTTQPYGLICPITRACDVLEPRWTIPILSEIWAGSTKFNEIRRGVGSISPALLSKRLKELEENGLLERIEDPATGSVDYIRTQMAVDLEPALNALGVWAQKYIEAEIACEVNLSSLTWKMRKYIVTEALPKRRVVIRFHFQDEGLDYDTYWIVAKPGEAVQICSSIPGFDVDLWVDTTVASLSAVILARSTVSREIEAERMFVTGDAVLEKTMQQWLHVTGYIPEGGPRALANDYGRCKEAMPLQ
jgi:DNA-binding HxlR family transcriptional regulator